MVRFAHISDCHLGAWRQPELQELSVKAFSQAIDLCIKEKVEFVLITGDLLDNAMPSIEVLKDAAAKLSELKESNIDCYIIPGSHDFSVSGKTFLDVFEKASLFTNIAKHEETEDEVKLEIFEKNNLVLAGIGGKKAGLERNLLSKIKKTDIKNKNALKILALHTTLSEAKPKGMDFVDSTDSASLPDGFDYYALGHLHMYFNKKIGNKILVYPGPLFPASFSEFEELKNGSFCMVEWDEKEKKVTVNKIDILPKEVNTITIDANNKNPEQITQEAIEKISEINKKIITLRIEGMLSRGKTADIDFNKINESVVKNENILLKNTSSLTSPEFKVEIESKGKDVNEIEKEIIKEHEKSKENKEYGSFFDKIEQLLHTLDIEKQEGETNTTFEKRIIDETNKIFGL